MADNYLEKRYEEVFGSGSGKTVVRRVNPSLENLMFRTRSARVYDNNYEVMQAQLEAVVRVNGLVASARNQQMLRFKILTRRSGSEKMQGLYRLSGSVPDPAVAPEAFIIICAAGETRYVDIDLGISAQSMALKATELGLQSIIIASFDAPAVKEAFGLSLEPLLVMAFGKGLEKFGLVPAGAEDNLRYYEKDGVHCVPKLKLSEILL